MTDTENNIAPDTEVDPIKTLKAYDEVSVVQSILPKGGKELRQEIRYKASWRIVIAIEGHDLYDGKIKDISLHGAAILNGRNLKPHTLLTLHIHIPPMADHGKPRILKVQGKTSYTVHDDKHQCFRVGIAFIEFGLTSDLAYLEARLSHHHEAP
jgi:PilZ domain